MELVVSEHVFLSSVRNERLTYRLKIPSSSNHPLLPANYCPSHVLDLIPNQHYRARLSSTSPHFDDTGDEQKLSQRLRCTMDI